MKLHEKKLKQIIKAVEKYGTVTNIQIENSVIIVKVPKSNKVIEIDLNQPMNFSIKFTLGEEKETKGCGVDENAR